MAIKKIFNKKGRASYKAEFYVGRDPKNNNKRIYEYSTFSTKKEASEWLSEMHLHYKSSNIERSIYAKDQKKKLITIHLDSYLSIKQGEVQDNTYKAYKQTINKWIRPYFGMYKASDISRSTVTKFVSYLLKNNCSDNSQDYALGRLKSFFDYLIDESIIKDNPVILKKKNEIINSNKKIKCHRDDEVMELMNYDFHYSIFINTLFEAGLRIGEACALRVENLDFERKRIEVIGNLQKYIPNLSTGEPEISGAFYLKNTKGRERRFVPMTNNLMTKLRSITSLKKKSDFVFETIGKRKITVIIERGPRPRCIEVPIIHKDNFSPDTFKKVQIKLGLENVLSVHSTRHWFAIKFLMNGGKIEILSQLMGHKNINTTVQNYGEFQPEYLERVEQFIGFSGDELNNSKSSGKKVLKLVRKTK